MDFFNNSHSWKTQGQLNTANTVNVNKQVFGWNHNLTRQHANEIPGSSVNFGIVNAYQVRAGVVRSQDGKMTLDLNANQLIVKDASGNVRVLIGKQEGGF
jgi:hypothetical protein